MSYRTMLLSGNCFYMKVFKKNRILGPVDNILTRSNIISELLLENKYIDCILNTEPIKEHREIDFEGDSDIKYQYIFGTVEHNNPQSEKFINEAQQRVEKFNNFLKSDNANDFLIVILNNYDVDENKNITSHIKNTVELLKEKKLLNRTIFIEIYAPTFNRLREWGLLTNDFNILVNKYNLNHIILDERNFKTIDNCIMYVNRMINHFIELRQNKISQ